MRQIKCLVLLILLIVANIACEKNTDNTEGKNMILSNKDIVYYAKKGNLSEVQRSIENGADINTMDNKYGTPLISASLWGNGEIVKLLVKNGALVNLKDSDSVTALMMARKNDHSDVVEYLKSKGATE